LFAAQQWQHQPTIVSAAMQVQGQAQNGSARFMMVSPVQQQGQSPLMRIAPSPVTTISPSPVALASRPQVGSFVSPPQEGYRTVASPQMVQAQLVPAKAVQAMMQPPRYVQAVQPVQPQFAEMQGEQQIAYVHTAPIRWDAVEWQQEPLPPFEPQEDEESDYAFGDSSATSILLLLRRMLALTVRMLPAVTKPQTMQRDIPPPIQPPVVDDSRLKELEELLDNGISCRTLFALSLVQPRPSCFCPRAFSLARVHPATLHVHYNLAIAA